MNYQTKQLKYLLSQSQVFLLGLCSKSLESYLSIALNINANAH